MGEDVERTIAWKHAGYPAFSKFLASSKDCFAIRRFASLNVRVLLKLQNDIVELERELHRMDEYTKTLPKTEGGCNSFRLDADTPREELMEDIASRLNKYNLRLAAFLSIADRPSAAPEQIANLQNWLANRPNAIEAPEMEFLGSQHERDIIAIRNPRRTHFGHWMERLEVWRLATNLDPSRPQSTTRYYNKNLIKSLGGFLLLTGTLLFLLGLLWAMIFVRGAVARVAVITGFTVALSIFPIIGTTLKAFHRSAITSGYFAIAILVLGLSPSWYPGQPSYSQPGSSASPSSAKSEPASTTLLPSSTAQSAAATPAARSSNGLSGGAIAGIVTGTAVSVMIFAVAAWWLYSRRKARERLLYSRPMSYPELPGERQSNPFPPITQIPDESSVYQPSFRMPESSNDRPSKGKRSSTFGLSTTVAGKTSRPPPPFLQKSQAEGSYLKSWPYLKYVHELASMRPEVGFLVDWIQHVHVLREPTFNPAWSELRGSRVRVSIVEGEPISQQTTFDQAQELTDYLGEMHSRVDILRPTIIVVEDLSAELIEILGSHFDVDPNFFLAQVSTTSKDSMQNRWTKTLATERTSDAGFFVSLSYVRPWITSFEWAELGD